jgi:hypothetical protein
VPPVVPLVVKKGFEDLLPQRNGHPRPVIDHAADHVLVRGLHGQHHGSAAWRHITRVDREVHQQPLDLGTVRHGVNRRRRPFDAQCDRRSEQLRQIRCECLRQCRDVRRFQREPVRGREIEHLPRDGGGARHGTRQLLDLGLPWRAVRNALGDQVGVAADHRKLIVEVVRDVPGHPPHRFEPLGIRQLLRQGIARAQRRLELPVAFAKARRLTPERFDATHERVAVLLHVHRNEYEREQNPVQQGRPARLIRDDGVDQDAEREDGQKGRHPPLDQPGRLQDDQRADDARAEHKQLRRCPQSGPPPERRQQQQGDPRGDPSRQSQVPCAR